MEIDRLQLARMNAEPWFTSSGKFIRSYNFRIWTLEIEGKLCLVEYGLRPDRKWGLVPRAINIGAVAQ